MTLLPRLKAGFYLVVAGLVSGHPRPVCCRGATAFRHLPPPFLRTKEAALFIGVSCRTLEKHRIYGTGPNYSKISGRVCYAIGDLTEWAKRGAKAFYVRSRQDKPSWAQYQPTGMPPS